MGMVTVIKQNIVTCNTNICVCLAEAGIKPTSLSVKELLTDRKCKLKILIYHFQTISVGNCRVSPLTSKVAGLLVSQDATSIPVQFRSRNITNNAHLSSDAPDFCSTLPASWSPTKSCVRCDKLQIISRAGCHHSS